MNKFKIRASSCGKIMTKPKLKSETLSSGAKSYCENWLKENIYNRKIEFQSKYTQKGIINEEESIDFITTVLNFGFLF